jgi:hypothetical protein
MWLGYSWSRERKERFLLRHDLKKILTTYNSTWPSVFLVDSALELPPANYVGVFDNLDLVRQYVTQEWKNAWRTCWEIAVTVFVEDEQDEKESIDPRLGPLTPAEMDPQWALIGYDISDNFLLSGLSACGYDLDSVHELREKWAPHLNEYHLFEDVERAFEFKKFTDKRARVHAPFYVYGLYLIKKHTD